MKHSQLSVVGLLLILIAVFAVPRAKAAEDSAASTFAAAEEGESGKEDDTDKESDAAKSEKADADKPNSEQVKSDEKEAVAKEDEKEGESAAKPDDEKKDEAKADDKEAKKEEKKRETHKVEAKRFKVAVDLDGSFVASEMEEVELRPEEWSNYEIKEVIEHGDEVRAGDVLFQFDDEKLNEAIADLEIDQRISEIAIMQAEQELPLQEKLLDMKYTLAERNHKETQDDYKYYKDVQRPLMIESTEFNLKVNKYYLDYEKEELDQLEKMYEADDLTEETEEIILKRQRQMVDFYKFLVKQAQIGRDRTINTIVPRYDVEMKESLERADLSWIEAKTSHAFDLNKARYQLEKQKQARQKSLDRHAKLVGDRRFLVIKSPADGIVYYGRCVEGSWPEAASLVQKFQPHQNASPNSVLMTIVKKRPLHVTAILPETKRDEVAVGQTAKLAPPSETADKINARITEVSDTPVTSGRFNVELEILDSELPDWLVAGMSCKIKITTADKEEAILVPAKAVHADEYDEDEKYVWLVDSDDEEAKPERREVALGHKKGDDVEIIKGLEAGDVISLEDEDKKAKEESEDS